MLMSERKSSYYDEYQRKKETNRSLVTPPTLLTDRGAYVNFLEVQLERVSAACLAVQSYDDRFTDMQNLIIALENRCATTTRLTSLAQQCSEEIRAESYTITNKLNQELNNEQRKSTELFESLSSRVHSAEMKLQSIASLESRLLMLEAKYRALEDSKLLAETQHSQEIQQMKMRVEAVLAENHELRNEVDHTNTLLSQQVFDAKEETSRVKSQVNQLEDRFEARLATITQDCEAKLHAMQCKHNNYIDSLNYSFAQRELELNSIHSKQYGKVGCDLTELNQLIHGELSGMKSTLQASEQIAAEVSQRLSELKSDVTNQQAQLFQLEDKFITRLESLLSRYRFPSNVASNDVHSSGGSRKSRRSSRSVLQTDDVSEGVTPNHTAADLSEIQHVSSGSDSDGAQQNTSRSGRTTGTSNVSGNESVESELQALLKSILNTTTANNTALNAIAAVTASSAKAASADANKSWRNAELNLSTATAGTVDASAHGSVDGSVGSPRGFGRSRSLSPQRLMSSSVTTPAGAAVSIDAHRQRSHDSLRAMGVSPSRVMGPPPFLDAASVLKQTHGTRSPGGRDVGLLSPQRASNGGASGMESRSNSATSHRSLSGGRGVGALTGNHFGTDVRSSNKKSSKKSSTRKSQSLNQTLESDVSHAAVAELAKALSFSLSSPTRRVRNSTSPTLVHHTVSSLERLRQSAEARLMSPPRLSSGTAALFARPEQLEALRAKGIVFRTAPAGPQVDGVRHSGIEVWPLQQLQPAWKPINTYVPPASYAQFDHPHSGDGQTAGGANNVAKEVHVSERDAGGFDYASNNIVTKAVNHSAIFSHTAPSGPANAAGGAEVSTVNTNSVSSSSSLINAVKASLLRSEGTQTPTVTEGVAVGGGDGDSRSNSRNRGVQTEGGTGVTDGKVVSSSGSAGRGTRSGSNLRLAAQRLHPNIVDSDAQAAFYRPVSPLSHSRLSKILAQYPLPVNESKG